MHNPEGFKRPREEPGYRHISARLKDWNEIFEDPSAETLKRQSLRCMDCGVPFCQGDTGCPVQNEIPHWNELVAQDRWHEALDRLHATNNFPEFTGRLCPAPCEGACVLGLHSEAVTIKSVEWSIIDRGFAEGRVKPQKSEFQSGKKIAIVGSGPAGLAAAQQLARMGHSVVVFEKNAQPGGLLRYGIPEFKFEKWRIDRRLKQLEEEGVEFRNSVAVGRDISLADLRANFSAVGLAIGAELGRDLAIPGRELQGIHLAMDYLSGAISAKGKNVVILGGGDTGSDCLGTALRQGAASVKQFEILPRPPEERSESTPWPQWPLQLRSSHAHEEGGERYWSLATRAFVGKNGRVEKLVTDRLDWSNGSHTPKVIATEEFPANLVILALGFTGPKLRNLLEQQEIVLDPKGNIKVDQNFMTSSSGLFAAGDAARGASLIVWAISEGRKMAQGIDQFLKLQKLKKARG